MLLVRSLIVAGALLFAGEAVAQEDVDNIIRRGIDARRAGRDAEAYARFDDAWARCHCVEAVAHRGLAAYALGRWIDAERDLSAALDAPRNPTLRRWAANLRIQLTEVRTHLATVTVTAGSSGARVSVDDNPTLEVPDEGVALRLAEGDHTLAVEAPGHTALRRSVRVMGGQNAQIEFELTRVEVPVPAPDPQVPMPAPDPQVVVRAAPPATPAARRTIRRELPWRWLVAGGSSLLVGIVAQGAQQLLVGAWNDDACLAGGRTRAENCSDTGVVADAMQGVAITGYIAGAVLLSVGAARWLRRPSPSAWACAPAGVGATCAVSF